MLGPDARGEVDTGLARDPRVTHFWDEKRVAGRWLADAAVGGESYGGVVWDAFYVFGPKATWNERPTPVAGFGAPVIAETSTLKHTLARLLR
jgi:hypothetical protein